MRLTRRQCLGMLGSATLVPHLAEIFTSVPEPASQQPDSKRAMRGAFMIVATPYTASKAVDYDDLAAEIEWLAECGVQGMVWPQNSSEYPWLKRDEIMRGMEVVAKEHKGKQSTLILGVQQDDTKGMLELAAHAEALSPDALIAMPPKVAKSQDDYREYYSELAKATARPVFLQTVPDAHGVEFTVDLILELAGKYPHLGHVKEEHQPALERIAELARHRPVIQSVFGGKGGRTWAYELRLGSDGTITGQSWVADLFAKVWNSYSEKNWGEFREIYSKLLLMFTTEDEIPGTGRYLLKRRGIFKTTVSRQADYSFSPTQVDEIEQNLIAVKPYLLRMPAGPAV
jgi:4-hydroxy-tetrahydrodipicolinate synthase